MKWISVDDRLPEYGTYRINYATKSGKKGTATFDAYFTNVKSVTGEYFDIWMAVKSDTILDPNRVLHWYDIPEPPKQ